MDAKVTWQNGLQFIGSVESGFSVNLDVDSSVGGTENGFRPLELMGISLAGCTAMDVISIMRKKQQPVSSFEVKVHADQAIQHPKVFTKIFIKYVVTGGNIDEAALLRAMELSALKYCPAQAMLGKIAPMELSYEIYDEDGNLRVGGKYTPPLPQ